MILAPTNGLAGRSTFRVNLPQSSGIGFDRSDLAVIAPANHVGVAMGRKRLVQKASGEAES